MKRAHVSVGLALLFSTIAVLGTAIIGHAQGMDSQGSEPRTFGPSSIIHTVSGAAFTGKNPADAAAFRTGGNFERFCTGVMNCTVQAAVALPAGAVVTRLELEACDTSSTARVTGFWVVLEKLPSLGQAFFTVNGSPGATPGCGSLGQDATFPPTFPTTIDNANESYLVQVDFSDVGNPLTSATFFKAVRVFYHLQVSPAPAVASFGDVPTTHPQFQFVEALVSSGITVGCGNGNYCPDAPLTRGQMAVFLSKGLGLHFAP